MGDKNLCFFLQSAKGGGVDNPVAVALKRIAGCAFRLRIKPAAALRRMIGIGRAISVCCTDTHARGLFETAMGVHISV